MSTAYLRTFDYKWAALAELGFGFQQSYGNPSKAQAVLAAFPVGGQVTVYYDPNNPAEAVLERKAGGSIITLVVGIIFVATSLCIGCPVLVMLVLMPWTSGQ